MSPFQFGKTVEDSAFVNRQADIKRLKENLLSGINSILISPRRWGKSSLVKKSCQEIAKKNSRYKIVYLDLFRIRSEADFYESFASEVVKASSNKFEDWVKLGGHFLKSIIPQFKLGIDPQHDFSIHFAMEDIKRNAEELLNLPERLAKTKKLKLIICIDEFQNCHNFAESKEFEKRLRSVWQHHKEVTYCLYGSKYHMMTDIFNNAGRSFYRFGDMMFLKKISSEHWQKYISRSFRKTGKKISANLAKEIIRQMDCHSYYVQQFSHYVWLQTEEIVTDAIVKEALERLLEANAALYQRDVEALSNTQLNLLIAIVNEKEKLTSKAVMDEYKLGTPNNVIKNRRALEKKELLFTQDGKIDFLDPAFKIWFRRIL